MPSERESDLSELSEFDNTVADDEVSEAIAMLEKLKYNGRGLCAIFLV